MLTTPSDLMRELKCPLHNPTGRFDGSSREAIEAFKRVLDRARIPATVRLTRGREIAAACGQLAASRDRGVLAATGPETR